MRIEPSMQMPLGLFVLATALFIAKEPNLLVNRAAISLWMVGSAVNKPVGQIWLDVQSSPPNPTLPLTLVPVRTGQQHECLDVQEQTETTVRALNNGLPQEPAN